MIIAPFLLNTSLLRDRAIISVENEWIDEHGHVYIIYTRTQVAEETGWSKRTVLDTFRAWSDANLILFAPAREFVHYRPEFAADFYQKLHVIGNRINEIAHTVNSRKSVRKDDLREMNKVNMVFLTCTVSL